MDIKKGYKQTEFGVIPEDWEVKSVGDVTKIISGGTPSSTNSKYWNGNILWCTPTDITKSRTKYIFDTEKKITNEGLKNSSATLLPKGTLLLCSRATIGEVAIAGCDISTNQGFKSLICLEGYNNEFLYYSIPSLKNKMMEKAFGSTFLEISKTNLSSILVTFPTFAEQSAIATTLSDVDTLIIALDKKIAKKKLIKQGAMQQLLTGKKRLPGFSEKWVEKKMGEIAEIKDGTHQTPHYVNDGIPFYSVENITNNDFKNTKSISIEEHKVLTKSFKIEKGDVLMTRIGSIGVCKLIDWNVEASFYVSLALLKFKKGYSAKFFTHYSNTKEFIKDIEDHSLQHATPKKINLGKISFVKVFFPNSEKEQTAIAQVLSDMDNEIAALEAKRDKYKQLKNGMMQQLLTGQIRLAQKLSENRTISVDAPIVGGHIVNKLFRSKGWGRTKLQKSMHLVDYCCQLNFGGEYIRNIAGPDNQLLMNHIDSKFKQYRHVRIEIKKDSRGGKHYNYIPTTKIAEIEQAFDDYPAETQGSINNLLDKIEKMDLARAEIVSTLYAVWNNRIIKKQPINDDLLLKDFYDWSAHKSDYSPDLVLRGLNYMRQEGIIPIGWGKYIDKSKTHVK